MSASVSWLGHSYENSLSTSFSQAWQKRLPISIKVAAMLMLNMAFLSLPQDISSELCMDAKSKLTKRLNKQCFCSLSISSSWFVKKCKNQLLLTSQCMHLDWTSYSVCTASETFPPSGPQMLNNLQSSCVIFLKGCKCLQRLLKGHSLHFMQYLWLQRKTPPGQTTRNESLYCPPSKMPEYL